MEGHLGFPVSSSGSFLDLRTLPQRDILTRLFSSPMKKCEENLLLFCGQWLDRSLFHFRGRRGGSPVPGTLIDKSVPAAVAFDLGSEDFRLKHDGLKESLAAQAERDLNGSSAARTVNGEYPNLMSLLIAVRGAGSQGRTEGNGLGFAIVDRHGNTRSSQVKLKNLGCEGLSGQV